MKTFIITNTRALITKRPKLRMNANEVCDTCNGSCEDYEMKWCSECRGNGICKCDVCNENKAEWKYDENKQFCEDCEKSGYKSVGRVNVMYKYQERDDEEEA